MSQQLLDLPTKVFADGVDQEGIASLYAKPYIKGLTTDPTVMIGKGRAVGQDGSGGVLARYGENVSSRRGRYGVSVVG